VSPHRTAGARARAVASRHVVSDPLSAARALPFSPQRPIPHFSACLGHLGGATNRRAKHLQSRWHPRRLFSARTSRDPHRARRNSPRPIQVPLHQRHHVVPALPPLAVQEPREASYPTPPSRSPVRWANCAHSSSTAIPPPQPYPAPTHIFEPSFLIPRHPSVRFLHGEPSPVSAAALPDMRAGVPIQNPVLAQPHDHRAPTTATPSVAQCCGWRLAYQLVSSLLTNYH
jgi:hypothetical protein